MSKAKTFAIFVVYADLNRAFKSAYKHPLTLLSLAELIKNIVAHFKRSGLKPPEYPVPYVYLYLPYHPGALLSHENQLFLRELEADPVEGQPRTIEGMQIRKGWCEVEETTSRKWRLVDQEEWSTSEVRVEFTRAKQSNVSLAIDLARHDCDVAVLVAGDRDLVPAAKVVVAEKKRKVINVFIRSHWQETLGQCCSSFVDLRDLPALIQSRRLTQALDPYRSVDALAFESRQTRYSSFANTSDLMVTNLEATTSKNGSGNLGVAGNRKLQKCF